jgi:hypothetical protein
MKRLLIAAMFVFMVMFGAGIASAAHYIDGMESTSDTAALDSGFTVRLYNVWAESDTFRNNNGDSVGDFNQKQFTTTARLYYMTDLELLGAKYGLSIGVPFGYNKITVPGFESSNTNLGDMYFEPIILKWNKSNFDAFVSLGFFAPTGEFNVNDPASVGKNYWGGLASVGGTYYFDAAKEWSFGTTVRYEMNSEMVDQPYRPGDVFHVEYQLTKMFPMVGMDMKCKDKLYVGVNGYTKVQVTDNKLDDIAIKDTKEFVTAVGPGIGYHIDQWGMDVGVKSYFEFAAKNQPEGYNVMFALSKNF